MGAFTIGILLRVRCCRHFPGVSADPVRILGDHIIASADLASKPTHTARENAAAGFILFSMSGGGSEAAQTLSQNADAVLVSFNVCLFPHLPSVGTHAVFILFQHGLGPIHAAKSFCVETFAIYIFGFMSAGAAAPKLSHADGMNTFSIFVF